jgi:putative phosphoesterase
MKVAALYDVHGMLDALEAVLAEVPDDAAIVLGGDCIQGPQPVDTLERLRALGDRATWIRGNTDRAIAKHSDDDSVHADVARAIGPDAVAFLRDLPLTYRVGDVLFCHATPWSDEGVPDARDVGAAVVVWGHTHLQSDQMLGGTRWVNAGSVGVPLDRASGWVLVDGGVELRRTAYDLDAAVAALRSTGRPEGEHWVKRLGGA